RGKGGFSLSLSSSERVAGKEAMLGSCAPMAGPPTDEETAEPPFGSSLQIATGSPATKRKRRPAGTPDPDAEVVSLSPRTLLESDRYVCEICNQGFQRDQNLQMHRRRHKVPWKLLKREAGEAARKRVFVCPEPSCLHHDPSHALGDLVGIKKHFRRKHSGHRQWACSRCSKAYAVHSDYKAHLKTCGTRGHSCDCGRVFSRVESFIEHQDTCTAGCPQAGPGVAAPACGVAAAPSSQQQAPPPAISLSRSRTASSTSPSSDVVISAVTWPGAAAMRSPNAAAFHRFEQQVPSPRTPQPDGRGGGGHNLELQLMPPSSSSTRRQPWKERRGRAQRWHRSQDHAGGTGGAAASDGGEGRRGRGTRAGEAAGGAGRAGAGERQTHAAPGAGGAEPRPRAPRARRAAGQRDAAPDHLLQLPPEVPGGERPSAAMSSEVACSYVTEGGDVEVDNVGETLILDGMRRRQQHATMDTV
uniref:C2H2-type domain-containing protein n=1 Tax=Aegilops tauschii subsp. strangulata TaxID=200361 RepID=A0A453KYN0_AEGTS